MRIFVNNGDEVHDILDLSDKERLLSLARRITQDEPGKTDGMSPEELLELVSEFVEKMIYFIGLPMPTQSVGLVILENHLDKTAKDVRVSADTLYKHATKGAKQQENLALAIAARDELYTRFTSGEFTPEEMKDQGENMGKLLKVIDSEGKTAFTKDDDGKITLKGTGTRSGNGDRANPLPDFKTAENIKRGANGGAVLCTKTDGEWYGYKPDGTCHNLGKATSWTHLNNRIGKELLGGKGSDGVNGLATCTPDDLLEIAQLISNAK